MTKDNAQIKYRVIKLLSFVYLTMVNSPVVYGMDLSQVPTSQPSDKDIPDVEKGESSKSLLKPNPKNPVRILEPNPNDESRDDSEYQNPLTLDENKRRQGIPIDKSHRDFPLYKTTRQFSSLDHKPVPITDVDEDRFQWSLDVADEVNVHFSQPYQDNPNDKLVCTDGQVVYRPNHSLAHGMRQAYLAVDIVMFLSHAALSKNQQKADTASNALRLWVVKKVKNDPNFLKKIEFTNAFQRSGRQSDIAKEGNEEKYNQYLLNDQKNFQAAAEKRLGELFENQEEIDLYKRAITEKFDPNTPPTDLVFLSKILYTAHLLDLRRLHTFQKDKILKNISLQLFERGQLVDWEQNLLDKLWSQSGDYLKATGDRDMEDPRKTDYDPDVFCAQAHNPKLLVQALQLARMKPETQLLKSIVGHTETMRQLKEKNSAPPEEGDLSDKNAVFRKTLENAPYTASEGYLKLLLGEKYVEIPSESQEEFARKITMENVINFLSEPKRKDPNNSQKFLPRVENPDDAYIKTLVDCMMEERKNRGKVVLYHVTEPEMGFLYDVYTQLRNQLIMEGGSDIRALRVIDKGFLKLDEEVQKIQMKGANPKANVLDFMTKFKGVADSNESYRDLVLSTNFGLFGSDQQINADTYYMLYLVKDKKVATQALSYDTFFDFVEQNTGISGKYEDYKALMDQYVLTCRDGKPCRNGRLIQIFIDPQVLTDVAYFSVLMGAPVLKEGATPSLDIPITLLRTEPTKLLGYLENTKGADVGFVGDHLLRPNTLLLHDLQARLYMRPEIMFDSRLTMIKSYWRFGPPEELKAYYSAIRALVNQNLVAWLQAGAPSQPDAFAPETDKLKKFTQMVYQGSTGSHAPVSPPASLESQFTHLVLESKGEQAARMLEENYEDLLTKTFIVRPDRKGQGGGQFSLGDFIKRNTQDRSIYKVAFQKGLFKGGESAYEISLLLEGYDLYAFINALDTFKDPEKTFKIVIQYNNKDKLEEDSIVKMCQAIDFINNDESILQISKPLLDLISDYNKDRVLKAVYQIPASDRAETIQKTVRLISTEPEFERATAGANIDRIIDCVYSMRGLDTNELDYVWSIGKQIKYDWYSRAQLMGVLQKITWVPGKPIMGREISAPFTADDVISHANTKPEIYDMVFLESTAGKVLIAEIINKLNDHMIPKDDFASIASAYNRGNPDAGYNKSLIADYVSTLKERKSPAEREEEFRKNIYNTVYSAIQDHETNRVAVYLNLNDDVRKILFEEVRDGLTLFRHAIGAGNVDMVQLFLDKASPEEQEKLLESDQYQQTPVYFSVDKGKPEMLRFFLKLDQDHKMLYQVDANGFIPLDWAIIRGDVDIVKILLEKDSNLWNHLGKSEANILYYPDIAQNWPMIQFLFDNAPKELLGKACHSMKNASYFVRQLCQTQK